MEINKPEHCRLNRNLVIIMVDLSASMFEAYIDSNGYHLRKGDYAVKEVNKLLNELYMRAHNGRRIENRYDIAVITYSGDQIEVISSYDRSINFTPINKLYRDSYNYFSIATQQSGYDFLSPRGGDGAVICRINGFTPMYQALESAYELISRWCAIEENRSSEAPKVINISDGMATDADYAKIGAICERIQQHRTAVNTSQIFNILVSSVENASSINLPTDKELERVDDRYIVQMALTSSFMPPYSVEQVETLRQSASVKREYRAIAYDIDPSDLFDMLFDVTSTGCKGNR